jgi:CubicO group peptidase (beta-lactamase class C family)
MSNYRQPPDPATYAEVASRNLLRNQSGLPPVELRQELDRRYQVQQRRAFEQWMQSPLRYRVQEKLLQRIRRRLSKPDWPPTGILSGGGWAFHVVLVRQMQRLSDRLGEPAES